MTANIAGQSNRILSAHKEIQVDTEFLVLCFSEGGVFFNPNWLCGFVLTRLFCTVTSSYLVYSGNHLSNCSSTFRSMSGGDVLLHPLYGDSLLVRDWYGIRVFLHKKKVPKTNWTPLFISNVYWYRMYLTGKPLRYFTVSF